MKLQTQRTDRHRKTRRHIDPRGAHLFEWAEVRLLLANKAAQQSTGASFHMGGSK